MIERFYLRDYLSFREAELNIKPGLIVFSGPSGSGKSILMGSLLSSLGYDSCDAAICESSVTWELNGDDAGIEVEDVNVFKHIKKEKSRYFINNQSVSKKAMLELSSGYLKHLALRDFSDFENENLLLTIDGRLDKRGMGASKLRDEYAQVFAEHRNVTRELEAIKEEQRKIVELKEFATFEIKKIESVNPKIAEDEELLEIKKELSKKEKALQGIAKASAVFEHEHGVINALELLNTDGSFFSDCMNELRAVMESAEERFGMLEEVNVEDILNRIEELGELKRRYGSIEDALKYKEQKIAELAEYENIEITKGDLEEREQKLRKHLERAAEALSKLRKSETASFEADLNKYLAQLYLRDAQVRMSDAPYGTFGKDGISLKLNETDLQKVSTGEFNRLRLAVLALRSEFMAKEKGVLMLDEIDANLSGEESMSVARVLKKLSKYFQIFVISHQPQLTSMGDQHFLVYKEGQNSHVKSLEPEERIEEIARIISGESITQEARMFAKELLEANGSFSL